jgi:hypothetical protein
VVEQLNDIAGFGLLARQVKHIRVSLMGLDRLLLLTTTMSTKKPKTPAHPRSKKASLDEKARHTQAQADYRARYIGCFHFDLDNSTTHNLFRNLEATREKAKLRMQQ